MKGLRIIYQWIQILHLLEIVVSHNIPIRKNEEPGKGRMLMYLYHTWWSGLPWQRMIQRNRCIFLRLVALLIFFSFVATNSNCIISDVICTCIIVYIMHVDYLTLWTWIYMYIVYIHTYTVMYILNANVTFLKYEHCMCTCTYYIQSMYMYWVVFTWIHNYMYTYIQYMYTCHIFYFYWLTIISLYFHFIIILFFNLIKTSLWSISFNWHAFTQNTILTLSMILFGKLSYKLKE